MGEMMTYDFFWMSSLACFFTWMDDGRVISTHYVKVPELKNWTVRKVPFIYDDRPMKKRTPTENRRKRRWKGGTEA